MRENFQPIGDRARWRVCYDALAGNEPGTIITYAQLSAVLDAGISRERIQGAVRRAAKDLLVAEHKALDPVPNVGYRIVHAEEHMDLAKRDQRRSRRALVKGHTTLDHTDLNQIEDPVVRRTFQAATAALAQTITMVRWMDLRHSKLAERVQEFAERSDRTESEVEELRRRLAKLEALDTTLAEVRA